MIKYNYYLNGELNSLAEIARIVGVKKITLAQRVYRANGLKYEETINGYKFTAIKIQNNIKN